MPLVGSFGCLEVCLYGTVEFCLCQQPIRAEYLRVSGPMRVEQNLEGTEVDGVHEVTSPVSRPLLAAASQIGCLLGEIHVPQGMTNIIIFIQPFSKKYIIRMLTFCEKSHPPRQHLKNPPLARHFLAKLLNSAFRQSLQR